MTARERIDAAIAALDIARTDINECDYENIDAVLEAGRAVEDAAYDLVDEVIRLRKWQREVLPYLNVAAAQFKPRPLDLVTFNSTVGTIDRLIAEAQGD